MLGSTLAILAVLLLLFAAVAAKDLLVAKKKKTHYNRKTCFVAYGMILPAVVLAFIFVLLPIIYSLGYAFTDFYLLKPDDIRFDKDFSNFTEIIKSIRDKGELYHAIRNTSIFVVGVVPLQIGMALGLALFVNRTKKGVGVFKVCYFAPVVVSLTITSYLWLQILSPSEVGLLNSILKLFGQEPKDFLRDKDGAMIWIIVMSAWQGCGYQMLIFLSGLTNVRKELYEAAALDGATAWDQFLHVTCPGLRSTFLYILITVFVGACRVMIQPMLMTGYQSHTLTLSYYMYQQGYTYRWVGQSSAVALLMTIVIGSITLLQRRLLREKD
ncbi:MAG: sugar ABC transporter permease [Clostridia bacterium]|nr:sugar ABC transporter permease [Clostridia bacterium]